MDYEKKIRYYMNSSDIDTLYKSMLNNLFPELAESEDERIRTELIELIDCMHDADPRKKGWLAWLEKQGEPVEINPTEFDTRLQALIGKFDSLPKEELIGSLSFWMNVVQNDGTYKDKEKQGEQKFPVEIKTPEESLNIDSKTYNEIVNDCIFGENKPKFKVGDWVLYSGDHYEGVRHITKINENGYYIERNGLPHGIIPFNHEICMRLWTIQDAKDGDVLAEDPIEGHPSSFVAIYKKQNEEDFDTFDSYCFVGFDGKFYEGEYGHSSEDIHPATKEQRDILFQKMHEAGYMWDAKNKKLKLLITNGGDFDSENCEQNPTDLGEFINELSKQFPDVPFGKLSRIAVRTAKWAKQNFITI